MTVTLHRFLSRADRADRPDRLLIDLDPSDDDLTPIPRAELQALPSTVTTSGSRGLHVMFPPDARPGADDVRAFARDARACMPPAGGT